MNNTKSPPMDEAIRVFNTAPFIAELGIELVSLRHGKCETTVAVAPRLLQQDGFVHAGVQATLADHTAGGAAATMIGPGEIVLTAEFKINLLHAAKGERLRCHATVLKGGSQLIVAESEVFAINGGDTTLVSKATVTLAVVRKR